MIKLALPFNTLEDGWPPSGQASSTRTKSDAARAVLRRASLALPPHFGGVARAAGRRRDDTIAAQPRARIVRGRRVLGAWAPRPPAFNEVAGAVGRVTRPREPDRLKAQFETSTSQTWDIGARRRDRS